MTLNNSMSITPSPPGHAKGVRFEHGSVLGGKTRAARVISPWKSTVWRQLRREVFSPARCTVARLMRDMGLRGAIRGKPLRTTISDKAAPCPLDHVNRQFHASAPDRLWLADFTHVATSTGFVYVAFVIDAYARRIVGWRASRTAHADFVLDALAHAVTDRKT